MNGEVLFGLGIVLLAGTFQGAFAVPMKYARRWEYENIWLVFAATGLVVFPWLLTLITIPEVPEVYARTSRLALLAIVGFGACWGIGATLTGLALDMLGIGLAMAIILGLSASVGSLIPLLALSPERLSTPAGHLYLTGTAVMVLGIAAVSRAGALRDRAKRAHTDPGITRAKFIPGLLVAIASGLFSSALNFVYAFGTDALTQARAVHVSPVWAANVITAPAVSGGFFANCLYCVYRLRKNGTSTRFALPATGANWLYGALMGALWFSGQSLYGLGVYRMGSFGAVVGWPLLMGTIIVTSNAAGIFTGEWTASNRRTRFGLFAGIGIILIALGILSRAQQA